MTTRFAGRTVVITGVGRAGQVGDLLARAFAREGAALALLGRTQTDVDARAMDTRAFGAEVVGIAADLTQDDAVGAAAQRVAEFASRRGGVHALVHAAGGFGTLGAVGESERQKWDDMLTINLTTAYVTARAFVPFLRKTGGACVFFASAASLPGAKVANVAAYAAAKSGVIALMRAIAQEESANGVRANALAPSAIRTPENEAAMGKDARFVEPSQLTDMVLFLCSDGSSAVTGQVLALG